MQKNSFLDEAITILGRLQGIGSKSAKRILFNLINNKEGLMTPLIRSLQDLADNIVECEKCNNIDIQSPCSICANYKRDRSIICVVEDIPSLWTIENTGSYSGLYFVLKTKLSAIKGITPDNLNLDKLKKLITDTGNVKEVILATSLTIEGQITSGMISSFIKEDNLKVSVLAQGIPVGGEIDYLDEITITTAINSRKDI